MIKLNVYDKMKDLILRFAISGPPTNKGNRKLPNPPIKAGITIKKIITIAWAVIILLYSWLSAIYCTPGPDNSNLISTEKAVPINPENNAKIRYRTPISLAFEERNHLSVQRDKDWFLLILDFFVFSESLNDELEITSSINTL